MGVRSERKGVIDSEVFISCRSLADEPAEINRSRSRLDDPLREVFLQHGNQAWCQDISPGDPLDVEALLPTKVVLDLIQPSSDPDRPIVVAHLEHPDQLLA